MLRVLAALARRLRRGIAGAAPCRYEDDPDLIALWRPLVGIVRESNRPYHELVRRLFIAEDVEGIPRTLWDVSDGCAIRWLWERYLRERVALGRGRRPLVLDVGANDGFLGSMSLNLIQLGWNAILVEPLEEMMAQARRNVAEHLRDGQTVRFCGFALATRDGEALFEPEVGRDIAFMEGHVTDVPSSTTRPVSLVSVDRFVQTEEVRALLDAADLTVLSLDIEGEELEVLRRFLELGLRPDAVIVEHLRTGGEHETLLTGAGYRHLRRIRFNDLYVR